MTAEGQKSLMTRNVLPATQTMATLDPHNLVIELPKHTQAELAAACEGARESEAAMLAAHELTHWYDIVGTTWGQSYLDILFAAFDRNLSHPAPAIEAYPEALALFDADLSILFPSYYKYVMPNAKPRTGPGEWQMQLTMGARIAPDGRQDETDPILFVRFQDGAREIARQPVSVGSLLELRAVQAEVLAFVELTPLRPREERRVEEVIYQREHLKLFYHPELTTYSAAAHLLSRTFPANTEAGLVLTLGAEIAHLCLNVHPTHFARLTPPADLRDAKGRRVRGFKTRADRGYLFACLSHLLVTGQAAHPNAAPMTAALRVAGLPEAEVVFNQAQRFIERRRINSLQSVELRHIRAALQAAGLAVLAHRRNNSGRVAIADWANLPAPVMMDFEAETFTVGTEVLSVADVDFLNACWTNAQQVQRQALRAGRGLDFQFSDFVY